MYQVLKAANAELTAPGAMFEVKEIEQRGVTIKSYVMAPPSLRELWQITTMHGDKEYLIFDDERISYSQASEKVAALANWLLQQNITSGDRVAIAMRNYPEYMLAYWAIVSIGAVVVGMNAWWVADEMAYALKDSEPKVLIVDKERLARFNQIDGFDDITKIGVRLPDAVDGVTPWSEVMATGGTLPEATVEPDSDACVFYTSGTTGRPKGAQLTHRGCVSNVLNCGYISAVMELVAQKQGKAPIEKEAANTTVALLGMPLFHVGANNCLAQVAGLGGGKLILMYRWDTEVALKIIEAEKVTVLSGVPVMAREIVMHPRFGEYDTSSLMTLGGGGSQLQPDLVEKISSKVTNASPSTGYGMTETCGMIAAVSGDFFIDKPDSVGPALPNFDVKVVDTSGNELSQGQRGELCLKGSSIIKGYLNRPEATTQTIVDGWLHTGDVARIDEDGFIFIVDRIKDMLLRGGENIYCAEVESVVYEIDGVAECCVFGVPDDRLGEEVGIAIVAAAGTILQAEDIREYCATRMAKFKTPRYIWLLDDALPRNAAGKFLKGELRDSLALADAVS